ncbi:hypothetical protein EV401DRAFT_1892135 [Pisolithus croceorrhizus]|nr:hypothetical protein EV401DRAFT_1892135 [Pisolithus croceorrhizus]
MEKERTSQLKDIPRLDTAPRLKQTSAEEYRSGELTLGRLAVLRDLGEFPSVSLEYFKFAALPPLRQQIDVNQIKESLQRDATVWSNVSKRWAEFETVPKKSGKHEDETSKPLSKVFDAIVGEASKTSSTPAKLRFASRPTEAQKSWRTNSTRPDAYLLLVDTKSVNVPEDKEVHTSNELSDSWDNVAVSFEFKKGTQGKTGCKDVIWSLHHIMHSDPRRRATFGVTIENTEMRFWFTCRAVTLVSKSFNFCSEPEHLIYFFCSLAFAEDHELGWDPTIQRVRGEDLVYQTTRVISDFSADALIGSGTRVFEERPKSPNGTIVKNAEPLVLKDSWRDCDRDREDIILEQIFADLWEKKGSEQEEAMKYFVTVLAAGNVMVDGKIDSTDSLLRGSDLPAERSFYPPPVDEVPKAKLIRSGEGYTPTFPFVPCSTEYSKVPHRIHSRLVFKEVCQPIYELRTLDTVFATLEDTRKALQFLHSVDWVHRDISGGNVLRWGKIGKLADLEYAKRMDSNTTHEVRTGTLEFMACEVEAQKYLFRPIMRRRVGADDSTSFRFNPLHDMESVWWIATWILYHHVDQEASRPSTKQINSFRELFPGCLNSRFPMFSTSLNIRVLPASFQNAAQEVENLLVDLKLAYTESETTIPPACTKPLATLHTIFAKRFTSAIEHSRAVGLFSPTAAQRQEDPLAKRQREDPTPNPREKKQAKARSFCSSLPQY